LPIATMSTKGQVLIPKELRDRAHIRPGKKVVVRGDENRVIIEAAPDNPIEAGRGMFKSNPPLTRVLLDERRRDREREDRKTPR